MIHFGIAFILTDLDFYNDMNTLHIKTSKLCEKLFKMERQGRYDEALSEVGDLWQDKTGLPDTESLEVSLAAELILRCGSLFGFLGHIKQIPNSQEKSRNLLSTARNLFIELYNIEKIAECENYLALAYWRTGEINEADAWLEESFSHNLPLSNNARIYSYIIKSLILLSSHKPQEILDTLYKIRFSIAKCTDNCLKGSYYNQIGIAWDILGDVPKALENLELSKSFYEKARHKVYLGGVYNDLSMLYKTAQKFEIAHKMIDCSRSIFKKIKDRTHEGCTLDTKAQIFLLEGKFENALQTIDKSIGILKLGENATYLVGTYKTKIKILLSTDDISSATFCLIEAVEIARTRISEEAANALVNSYEVCLREHLTPSMPFLPEIKPDIRSGYDGLSKLELAEPSDNLELVLPSSLAMYQDIQGVWINNSHLEDVGLVRDSLAVVVPIENIKRGDLIAIEEKENQNVSCGFYDKEFGIVCLEGHDSEPLLFDEEKISIIGKIVGVAIERTLDGKLIVEPISH